MEIILKAEVHADLLFHCLAHMDTGQDASSLFSRAYIGRISHEKIKQNIDPAWLANELDKIKDIYVPDQKLRMVNFLPFLFKDIDQVLEGLRWLSGDEQGNTPHPFLPYFKQQFFSSPDSQKFLRALAEILQVEYRTFYQEYWEHQQERLAPLKERFRSFWKENGFTLLGQAMKGKKGVVIYLSLSMTKIGCGFSSGAHFGAAVKFPEEENEILRSFFFSVHEMTHLFLDEWTLRQAGDPAVQSSTMAGSEGYEVHLLKERAVLYADYLLCKKFLLALLGDYCRTFLEHLGEEDHGKLGALTPDELENLFKARISLPEKTIQMLEDFIQNLISAGENLTDPFERDRKFVFASDVRL